MLAGRPANGPPAVGYAAVISLEKANAEGSVDAPITWGFEPESLAPLAKGVAGERSASSSIASAHCEGCSRAQGARSGVWGADIDIYDGAARSARERGVSVSVPRAV